jgi:hypothetical protein
MDTHQAIIFKLISRPVRVQITAELAVENDGHETVTEAKVLVH